MSDSIHRSEEPLCSNQHLALARWDRFTTYRPLRPLIQIIFHCSF
jgi:hypothetical protein